METLEGRQCVLIGSAEVEHGQDSSGGLGPHRFPSRVTQAAMVEPGIWVSSHSRFITTCRSKGWSNLELSHTVRDKRHARNRRRH